MIPVYQREPGDCFRACIASMFELRLLDVPSFHEGIPNGKLLPPDRVAAMDAWLADRGFTYLEFGFPMPVDQILARMNSYNPGCTYLLTGRTREGVTHTVIAKGGSVIHDPGSSPGAHALADPCDDMFMRVGIFVMEHP